MNRAATPVEVTQANADLILWSCDLNGLRILDDLKWDEAMFRLLLKRLKHTSKHDRDLLMGIVNAYPERVFALPLHVFKDRTIPTDFGVGQFAKCSSPASAINLSNFLACREQQREPSKDLDIECDGCAYVRSVWTRGYG